MTGQRKKRRRPPGKPGHRRRRTLVVASVFTLAILLSCSRAVDVDNSNVNSGRQSGDLLSDDPVDSEDHVDDPRPPGMPPMKDAVSMIDTSSDDEEAGDEEEEEEELRGPTAIATAHDVATDRTETDARTESQGGVPAEAPAEPAEAVATSSVDTAVEKNTAAFAQPEEDATASEGVLREPTKAPATASAAAWVTPSSVSSAIVDLDDPPVFDQVAAADAAADTAVAAVAADEFSAPNSHHLDVSAAAIDGDDGDLEGVHVSSSPDIMDAETPEADAESLAAGADTATDVVCDNDVVRDIDEQQYDATGEERNQEERVGGEMEEIRQPEETSLSAGEETEERAKAARLPPMDQYREEAAGIDEANADGQKNDDVVGSRLPERSASAVVAGNVDGDGLGGAAATPDANVSAGGGPGGGVDTAASATQNGKHQHLQLPPEAATVSEAGLSLDTQASPTATVQPNDPREAPVSTPDAGDSLKKGERSGVEIHTGGAIDVAVIAKASSPSGAADPRAPSMAGAASASSAAEENQQSAELRGEPTPSTDATPAVFAYDDNLLQPQGAGDSHSDDGGGEGNTGGGHGTDSSAFDRRPLAGSEEASSQPESVEEDIAGPPGNHSRSGGRSDRIDDGKGDKIYGGGAERGQDQGVGEGREEKSLNGGVGVVGGDGDAGGGGGGMDDGTDFSRGSPEELAQRVRDMEAELVRKLLAEEDEKSLLDIWVEQAREYVLTQTVPPTDAKCDFSWSRLRCEPKCTCGARVRFGDYTPGRACRLLHPWERSPELCGGDGDGNGAGGAGESGGAAWDPSDEPALKRVLATTVSVLGRLRRAYEARVAPPSDPECGFSLETRRCEPHPLCRLRLRWGDLSLSRACRLATVAEKK